MSPYQGGLPLGLCVPAFLNCVNNGNNRVIYRCMLPDSDNLPASLDERFVYFPVARCVACQFGVPVARRVGWHTAVFWATMPETAIHEYGDLGAGENNVRSYATAWYF